MSTVVFEAGRADRFDAPPIPLVANIVALLEVARDEWERDREAAKASLNRATRILRSELERRETASKSNNGVGGLAGWQVQRLRTHIDAHLSETIHVKDLSGVARRSTAHLCRAFKRTFGMTPHAYITARRLERAKSLMLESDEPLSVIAVSCGFTDQAHLSKLFRLHTGEAPGGWRRRRMLDEGEPPARPHGGARGMLP